MPEYEKEYCSLEPDDETASLSTDSGKHDVPRVGKSKGRREIALALSGGGVRA